MNTHTHAHRNTPDHAPLGGECGCGCGPPAGGGGGGGQPQPPGGWWCAAGGAAAAAPHPGTSHTAGTRCDAELGCGGGGSGCGCGCGGGGGGAGLGAPAGRVAAITRDSISATPCSPGGVRPASRAALRAAVSGGRPSWNQGCWMTSWMVMRCV